MTNSASDPGADDVLASIRRLIQATPDRQAGGGGRLLLTPALRVADPDEEAEPAPAPAPRVLTLEDRIAELEAAVGSQATEFEPDGSEVAHLRPPEDLVRAVENLEIEVVDDIGAVAEPDAEAMRAPELAPEPAPEPEPQRPARGLFLAVPPQDRRDEDAAAAAVAVPVESAPAIPAGLFFTRHDRAAEDVGPSGDATEEVADEVAEEVAPGPVDGFTATDAFEIAEAVPEVDREAAPEVVADVSAVIDAKGAFPGAFTGAFAPAVPQDDTPHDEAPHDEAPHQEVEVEDDWHDDAVISPVWTRHAPAAEEDEAPETPAFRHAPRGEAAGGSEPADAAAIAPSDAPAIDDEQLRALIAVLLREELQGPLGERITRNIRKLVRREIERALAVRDFE
jgi:hypothetical protein